MKPIFQINGNDYTDYLAEDGLTPERNDLDADGSGRNILDGLMYRSRIASKDKWAVSMNRLPETVAQSLAADLDSEYIEVTLLDPRTNAYLTKTYYCSSVNYGVQRYVKSDQITVYQGMSFNITER